MKARLISLPLTVVVLLTGCSGSEPFPDIDAFMAEKKARPAGQIEPIPPLRAYKAFNYSASGLRSPFVKPVEVKEITQLQSGPNVKPDPNRVKEYLEQFSLDSLRMVGSLELGGTRWALIRDGEGSVHRVKVGNYLGRNDGKVVESAESRFVVIEIVSNGAGGWVERPRTLELQSKQ